LFENGYKLIGVRLGHYGSIDKKTGFKDNIALGRLAAWFGAADNSHLYSLTAMGTGDSKDHGLRHYAFGNGSDHRVDTIQAVVQHIEALLDALEFLRLTDYRRSFRSFLRQSDTS
jgi:hypothetical protein